MSHRKMRLWSIHPRYLDSRGLVALWREALLAKKVLQNQTKGYKTHPQLKRFKEQGQTSSILLIDIYLVGVYEEATKRGFKFNKDKIASYSPLLLQKLREQNKISVSSGQIKYELNHLLKKLKARDKLKYNELKNIESVLLHPIFQEVSGPIEKWERT